MAAIERWREQNGDKDVSEVIDYMLELVSAVVPFAIDNESANLQSKRTQQLQQIDSANRTVNELKCESDSDCEILDSSEEKGTTNRKQEVEDITCEVSFDVDFRKCCFICEREGDLCFQVFDNGKMEFICSQECLKQLRQEKTVACYQCKNDLSVCSQCYLSNFGPQNAAFCSEQCLLKFESENGPISKCFECNSEIKRSNQNSAVFYWQTMNFCSIQCVTNLQIFLGEKCAYCKKKTTQIALGKYSVRFGDIVRQFCDGACLESYKKDLTFCAFCQKELTGIKHIQTRTGIFGNETKKRMRDFCDEICLQHYEEMIASKNNSNSSNSGQSTGETLNVGCCQCQRIIGRNVALKIHYQNEQIYLCGSTCIAAFKYSNDIHSVICENCYRFDWPLKQLTSLYYSGLTKLFCSKKCLNIYVLRNRKIVSCLTCRVKKYDFDLIEKFEFSTNNSKMFCSIFCLGSYQPQKTNSNNEAVECSTCGKVAIPHIRINIDNELKSFCSSVCMTRKQIALNNVLNASDSQQQAFALTSPSTASTTSTCSSTRITIQPIQQAPVLKISQPPIPASNANAFQVLTPPNISLTPTTVASTMWTPSFASMQTSPSILPPPNVIQKPTTAVITQPLKVPTINPAIRSQQPTATQQSLPSVEMTTPRPPTIINTNRSISTPSTAAVSQPSIGGPQVFVPSQQSAPVKEKLIIKQIPPKILCNKATMYRASKKSKAVACSPYIHTKAVDTGFDFAVDGKPKNKKMPMLVPVPVPIPIFLPISIPYPVPVPFPIAVPVPLFIPSDKIRSVYSNSLPSLLCEGIDNSTSENESIVIHDNENTDQSLSEDEKNLKRKIKKTTTTPKLSPFKSENYKKSKNEETNVCYESEISEDRAKSNQITLRLKKQFAKKATTPSATKRLNEFDSDSSLSSSTISNPKLTANPILQTSTRSYSRSSAPLPNASLQESSGLSTPVVPVKRKRGRPPKNLHRDEATKQDEVIIDDDSNHE